MAAGTQISVEEYVSRTFHPDCDYIDGEVRERNVGEYSHGRLQAQILGWFMAREIKWRPVVVPETRLQISPARFRIPDVMVLSANAPREEIVRTPPVLCIEIMSRDDRMNEILKRADDYFNIGVPVCWIVNSLTREGWVARPGELLPVGDGVLRAGEIEMPLADVLEA